MRIKRSKRKLNRIKRLKLLVDIPKYQYCWSCKYKKYTAYRTDYYVIGDKEIKTKRRLVYCKLNKRKSLDDTCMSDGLKWCGINDY